MLSGGRASWRDTLPRLFGCSPLRPGSTPPGVDSLRFKPDTSIGVSPGREPQHSFFAPKLSLQAGKRLMRRLLDHRLDLLFIHRLAFKPGGALDQGNELLGLSLRLLAFQLASFHVGIEAEPRPKDSAMATIFAKLAAAWRPDRTR